MVIHELTKQTGVPAKTIRYYESIGLLPRPKRTANNYRQYTPADVERLRFRSLARWYSGTRWAGRRPCLAPGCTRGSDTRASRPGRISCRPSRYWIGR